MPTITIGANTGDTYAGFDETKIRQLAPTTNHGTDGDIEVSKYSGGDWTSSLIKATGISSIPTNSIISAVSIFLDQYDCAGANGTYVIVAKRCLRNWVETQATWNIYSTGNSWGTAGAFGDAVDRDAAATFTSAGLDLSTSGYKELVGNGDAVYDVQRMFEGAIPNYGWVLERTDAFNDFAFRKFSTSEAADGLRPYLSVTYSTPAGQPRDKRSNTVPGSRLGGSKFGRGV